MTRIGAAAAALTLAALAPAAAQAGGKWFPDCDGFAAPYKKGDGMTSASLFGAIKVSGALDTKVETATGTGGVAACDTALADPLLQPVFWLRRVSLLKSRAIHRLEAGDTAGAMADLAAAKAAAQEPDELFYRRSLGLDLTLTRAFALRMSGDSAGAEALALEAWRARPWNLSVVTSALGAMGSAGLEPRNAALFYTLGQLQPRLIDVFFLRAYGLGRWDETAALYPQLSSPRSRTRYYYNSNEYEYLDPQVVEPFWAKRSEQAAVALAVLGRVDEARSVMAAARKRVEDATRDPPPPPETPTGNIANKRSFRYVAPSREDLLKVKQARDAYDQKVAQNHRIAAAVGHSLDDWQAALDQVLAARTQSPAAALAAAKALRSQDNSLALAMIDILLARSDTAAQRAELLAEKARRTPSGPSRDLDISPRRLFDLLPDAETADLVTRFHKKNDLWGLGTEDGFYAGPVKKTADGLPLEPGEMLASFRGKDSPKAMVEELALLQAAQAVRAAGFDGFIILDRSDTEFIMTSEAGQTSGTPLGWESRLYILPVHKAALPAKYQPTPWRVVDAAVIWDALSPVYLPADGVR